MKVFVITYELIHHILFLYAYSESSEFLTSRTPFLSIRLIGNRSVSHMFDQRMKLDAHLK